VRENCGPELRSFAFEPAGDSAVRKQRGGKLILAIFRFTLLFAAFNFPSVISFLAGDPVFANISGSSVSFPARASRIRKIRGRKEEGDVDLSLARDTSKRWEFMISNWQSNLLGRGEKKEERITVRRKQIARRFRVARRLMRRRMHQPRLME